MRPRTRPSPTALSTGIPSPEFFARQDALGHVADKVEKLLMQSPTFGAVALDAQSNCLTVFATTHPAADEWSKAKALIPRGVRLKFEPLLVSRDQADELSAYLSGRFKAKGLDLSSSGLDLVTGKFRVGLRSGALSAEDERQLARFGPDSYFVVHQDIRPVAGPT